MTFAAAETLQSSGDQDYLYYGRSPGALSAAQKSGKNNGVQYADTPSPAQIPVTGRIKRAVLSLRKSLTGVSAATYPCAVQFDLNSQRWTSDGTKIGDVDFSIPDSSTPVGGYGMADTNFIGSVALDIPVTAGDLVGLKYIRGAGVSNQTRDVFHVYVTLIIEEDLPS